MDPIDGSILFTFDVSIDGIHGMDAPSQYDRNGSIDGAIKWSHSCEPICLAPSMELSNGPTSIDSYGSIDGAIKCSHSYEPILLDPSMEPSNSPTCIGSYEPISLAHFMAPLMEPFLLTRISRSQLVRPLMGYFDGHIDGSISMG